MKHRIEEVSPKFVEYIPERLVEGDLYISERFRIASHLCCCGCGQEVITPLSPAEWKLIRDGNRVSLHPSIGNWSFFCKSHYWIKRNRVEWAAAFNARQIDFVQQKDRRDIDRYIAMVNTKKEGAPPAQEGQSDLLSNSNHKGLLQYIFEFLKKLFGE
jgi:hypothetical protein